MGMLQASCARLSTLLCHMSAPHPCRAFQLRVVTLGGNSSGSSSDEEGPAAGMAPVDADDDNPFANFEQQAGANSAGAGRRGAAPGGGRALWSQQTAPEPGFCCCFCCALRHLSAPLCTLC